MRLRVPKVVAITAFVLFACGTRAHAATLLLNSGFEAGLAAWTVVDQAGGSGTWFSQSGTGSPLNGFLVPPPTEGVFAAMTDQGGPGSHVLYQDFVVPVGVTSASISFDYFVNNLNGAFIGGDLDYTAGPRQYARVDIMEGGTGAFSVAAADIAITLQMFFANTAAYQNFSWDLTTLFQAYAGQTLRLRFAEVDNQFFFNLGIDNVVLNVETTAVPEPASLLLLGTGLSFGIRRLRRRA